MDSYGKGEVVEALEKIRSTVTGKEKAITCYWNTLPISWAIAALSGNQPKYVPRHQLTLLVIEAECQTWFTTTISPLAEQQDLFHGCRT